MGPATYTSSKSQKNFFEDWANAFLEVLDHEFHVFMKSHRKSSWDPGRDLGMTKNENGATAFVMGLDEEYHIFGRLFSGTSGGSKKNRWDPGNFPRVRSKNFTALLTLIIFILLLSSNFLSLINLKFFKIESNKLISQSQSPKN